MEDVIQTYFLPYDPAYPVICFDEACKQLCGEVRPFQPPGPGMRARLDYEYERQGVCHQRMMCEPLRGWRHVQVTERRLFSPSSRLHQSPKAPTERHVLHARTPVSAGALRSASSAFVSVSSAVLIAFLSSAHRV